MCVLFQVDEDRELYSRPARPYMERHGSYAESKMRLQEAIASSHSYHLSEIGSPLYVSGF